MSNPAQLRSDNLRRFILAGNATFTVKSNRTGNRLTFRVRQPRADSPHFVSVMTGPDNELSYSFVGSLFRDGSYRHGKRSKIEETAKPAIAAKWIVERVSRGEDLPDCEVWHAGKCGRCGRKLTVPESIETGIGPDCAKLFQ